MEWLTKGRKENKVKYLDSRISLDIETTTYETGSIVYNWAICQDGEVFNFRYFDEVLEWFDDLKNEVGLNNGVYNGYGIIDDVKSYIIVYVHNLAFEWSFIKHYFKWSDVFTVGGKVSVIRARTECGLEFRCSYALTNESLATVAKDVGMSKIKDLDYQLKRHSETVLTDEEMRYIRDDVVIMDKKLEKLLEKDTLATIPMTSTGYVRRDVRKTVMKDKGYKTLISKCIMDMEVYTWSKQAFMGGYTHASNEQANKSIENVMAYDLASSYPAVITRKLYPLSTFADTSIPNNKVEFENMMQDYACLIDIEFENIECKYSFSYISESKTLNSIDAVLDNGRIDSGSCRVIITEVDYNIIRKNYNIGSTKIKGIKIAKKGPLPKVLIDCILDYYHAKTVYKGDKANEETYGLRKALLNGVYGMMATDPIRERLIWSEIERDLINDPEADIDEMLMEYNTGRQRFLYYPWGCWVTAYAREELMSTIMALEDVGVDVIYCDTDSIYYKDSVNAVAVFNKRNSDIIAETLAMSNRVGYDYDMTQPERKGVKYPIGVWEDDTDGVIIKRFKTLGAKRYIKDHKGSVTITVSGIAKKEVSELFNDGHFEFDDFRDGLVIDKDISHKNSVSRFNHTVKGYMTDHNGVTCYVEQTGGTVITPIDAKLDMSPMYLKFLELNG